MIQPSQSKTTGGSLNSKTYPGGIQHYLPFDFFGNSLCVFQNYFFLEPTSLFPLLSSLLTLLRGMIKRSNFMRSKFAFFNFLQN